MNKSQVKILIIVSLIFVAFFVVISLYSSKVKNENNFYDGSVIIDATKHLSYESKKWESKDFGDFSSVEKFKVYSDNNYVGDYVIRETNEKYYFFDKDYNSYDINSPFLAISHNSNLSIVDLVEAEITDEDESVITRYLKSIDIVYNGDYSVKEKYVFSNGENNIYIISNQLYSDYVFYLVFAKYGNKLVTINNQINVDEFKQYKVLWVLNSNIKGYNDLILGDIVMENYNCYFYSYDNKLKGYNELF